MHQSRSISRIILRVKSNWWVVSPTYITNITKWALWDHPDISSFFDQAFWAPSRGEWADGCSSKFTLPGIINHVSDDWSWLRPGDLRLWLCLSLGPAVSADAKTYCIVFVGCATPWLWVNHKAKPNKNRKWNVHKNICFGFWMCAIFPSMPRNWFNGMLNL